MKHQLAIHVSPRSARPGIGQWRTRADGREIRVAEAPAGGAANDAVVRLLARALGVSRSEVAIVAGATARHKRVAIPFGIEEARRRIGG